MTRLMALAKMYKMPAVPYKDGQRLIVSLLFPAVDFTSVLLLVPNPPPPRGRSDGNPVGSIDDFLLLLFVAATAAAAGGRAMMEKPVAKLPRMVTIVKYMQVPRRMIIIYYKE